MLKGGSVLKPHGLVSRPLGWSFPSPAPWPGPSAGFGSPSPLHKCSLELRQVRANLDLHFLLSFLHGCLHNRTRGTWVQASRVCAIRSELSDQTQKLGKRSSAFPEKWHPSHHQR